MELREKIRELVLYWSLNGGENAGELADDILAIPEIAEAMERDQARVGAKKFAASLGHSISTNPPR